MLSATGISILVLLMSLGWILILSPFIIAMMIPFAGVIWMGIEVFRYFVKLNKKLVNQIPKKIILPVVRFPVVDLKSRLRPIPIYG